MTRKTFDIVRIVDELTARLMPPLDVQFLHRQSVSLTDRGYIWVIGDLTVCRRVNLRLHVQFLDCFF